MIGDTLFDCGESLDHYLTNYVWPEEVTARVRRLRQEIREVQRWLDSGTAELLGNVQLRDPDVFPRNRPDNFNGSDYHHYT